MFDELYQTELLENFRILNDTRLRFLSLQEFYPLILLGL